MSLEILVLNLTRIGDLVQTSPLIRGLKEQEPDCRITMLANVKFAGIVKFVEGVDELITFDMLQFGFEDDRETDTLEIYNYLDRLTADLKSRKFDRIINLSHTKLSAMLTMMIHAPDIRGFTASASGTRLVENPWLIYFTSFLNFRKLNRFNLVDIYMRGAGLRPGSRTRLNINPAPGSAQDPGLAQATRLRMAKEGIVDSDTLVGIQAGASREDRRWSPGYFAEVADRLIEEKGARIVLFGAAAEKRLGDHVESAMAHSPVNLIGATDLGELIQWVKRLDLLITNDTGTMHIAAAVNTPVAALFFVHARAEETGPYCDNAVILQADIDCAPCSHHTKCGHHSCLEYITPDDVYAASEMLLEGKQATNWAPGRVRVYRSCFHEDGGIDFAPMYKYPLCKSELFAYMYKPIFIHILERWNVPDSIDDTPSQSAFYEIMERFSPASEELVKTWINRAVDGSDKLMEITGEGEALAAGIVNTAAQMSPEDLATTAGRLRELDQAIAELACTHEALGPLAFVYGRRVENFTSEDAVELARQAWIALRWLGMSTSLLKNTTRVALEKLSGKREKVEELKG